METRKTSISKPSSLPKDYLKMVTDVLQSHFDQALKIYSEICPESHFIAQGAICSEEIWISASIVSKGKLSGATVYASCDFDPKASSPSAQDLLGACVDSIGTVFGNILNEAKPDLIKMVAEDSAEILDQMPSVWTPIETNQREVFIRFDRSNPVLESLADDWLKKNDPELAQIEAETEEQMKDLFFIGPKKTPLSSTGNGSGFKH